MITEEEEMDSPTINTRNTLAKGKEETRLDKGDFGKCENPRDLQGITGGQILKTNQGCGHILVHYLMTNHNNCLIFIWLGLHRRNSRDRSQGTFISELGGNGHEIFLNLGHGLGRRHSSGSRIRPTLLHIGP